MRHADHFRQGAGFLTDRKRKCHLLANLGTWVALRQFLQDYTVLAPDVFTADLYGNIKAALKGKGKPIPENDMWIAAIAMQYDLPLFTADKHFKEVDRLTLA